MSYQRNNNQKTNSGSNSVSEAVALSKGLSFPAVPALQRQGAEEELQMKKNTGSINGRRGTITRKI